MYKRAELGSSSTIKVSAPTDFSQIWPVLLYLVVRTFFVSLTFKSSKWIFPIFLSLSPLSLLSNFKNDLSLALYLVKWTEKSNEWLNTKCLNFLYCKCVFTIRALNKQKVKGSKQDALWQQRELPLLGPKKNI